jgi:ligand-binding sensor domain-containing protein/signal transduction histidine kinase
MISIRPSTACCLWLASRILLLCVIPATHALLAAEPRPARTAIAGGRNTRVAHPTKETVSRAGPDASAASAPRQSHSILAPGGHARVTDLKFAHLTTDDGLSQNNVIDILQDRRGFMWFATGDGLNRYDGNAFVIYKNDPDDPGSISHNFIRDLMEDDQGNLWVAAYPGVNKFDPTTERFTRYVHDPKNPNSLIGESVESIVRDSRGYLWFGTSESGLDRFDPNTHSFTHYRHDSDGQFVGRITRVIEDSRGDIWFVGQRGLFHLNPATGQITRPPATNHGLAADDLYEDDVGNLWMLAFSPIVGLVKYDRQAERLTSYPLDAGAAGQPSSKLLADGANGFWVPSSLGLYYFDRHTERLTRLFQHAEADPGSLNDNSVVAVFRDRSGPLWVGTANGGLNILNFREAQFGHYTHRAADPHSLSQGRVMSVHEASDGILWVGFFPRALDRLDRKTGTVTHYVPDPKRQNTLSQGGDINSVYRDARGHLWLGGWAGGLDRFDERTGKFKHYGHDPHDPASLMSDHVLSIYEDRNGRLWVGQFGGVSLFDPATGRFTNYRPDPSNVASLAYSVSAMYQDRSGTLWLGTLGGILSRFDDKSRTFINNPPDLHDPRKLQGGSIGAIQEDRAGRLWLASGTGLYRYDRESNTFTRYTEKRGLPSNDIMGILEDAAGRLWLSTKRGISRFDSQTETFRNYDVSDGLRSNEFSRSCHQQGQNGEMFFCGSDGITTFFPEDIRDNPYVPPVVITSFRIFNEPVAIDASAVLNKAVSYVDSLVLSHEDSVFSLEFAALSYANSRKNRYRYRLEGFDPGWNEVGSTRRLATYTNLEPGHYVFRVQGSNSDGVWNGEGVSLPILITPPWWRTDWFRVLCVGLIVALLWAAYRFRMRQVKHAFDATLEARVGERTRIARELHDTLLQSFHGLLLRFQTASYLLPDRPAEAKEKLDGAIEHAARAITEGRDAVQGLRASTVERNDLAVAIRTLGDELAANASTQPPPAFRVGVEGQARDLHPILRDEIYKIAAESLRNAFRHAQAGQVEAEIRYDSEQFRLRVRDDGKGIDPVVLASQGIEGHYGLRGMPERAALIGGKLALWSEVGAGTEVELRLPASIVYATSRRRSWWSRLFASRSPAKAQGERAS